MRAIARGRYNLLLGAGASAGALNGEGQTVPGATELTKRLIERFGIPTDGEDIRLPRAYEAAKNRRDVDGRTVFQYLASELTECSPPDWYEFLCSNRWSRIWTLNIDDVVEQAYEKWDDKNVQRPVSLDWSARFREPDQAANEVIVLHLHGRCLPQHRGGALTPELVFDIGEYHRAATRPLGRHIFEDEFTEHPFIVIGARLAEEYDLAEILRKGNQSATFRGLPSMVVLRTISALQREEFTRWGLIPIEADAGSFFTTIAKDITAYVPQTVRTATGITIRATNEEVRFLRQFDWLDLDRKVRRDPHHDLYAGFDPVWSDILSDRDAQFEVVDRMVERTVAKRNAIMVYCLLGEPFSGKSTALLRIANRLIVSQYDVFSFRGEAKLDVAAAVWWLQQSPKTVLMFDGLADVATEIGQLIRECSSTDATPAVIGSERLSRRVLLYSGIPAQNLDVSGPLRMRRLSDTDIERLLDKLHAARRLGRLTGWTREAQRQYFKVTAHRQLLDGMSGLEAGRGFTDRISTEYARIDRADHQRAFVISCITYALGYPIPAAMLSSAARIKSSDLSAALIGEGSLSDLLVLTPRGVKPRHRRVASTMLESVLTSKEQVYELALALAKELAPYITPDTIRQRTLPYLITSRLMDHALLSQWIGSEHIAPWYDEVESSYDWNARYWEQRALAAARRGWYDRAESYAASAVERHRGAFTLTTLGTILLRKAVQWSEPGSDQAEDYFWRGVERLREARQYNANQHPHPYNAFFTYTLQFVDRSYRGVAASQEIIREWRRWWDDALRSPSFEHPELREQLQRFQEAWLIRNTVTSEG